MRLDWLVPGVNLLNDQTNLYLDYGFFWLLMFQWASILLKTGLHISKKQFNISWDAEDKHYSKGLFLS